MKQRPMPQRRYEEMPGHNARDSTTRLMRSLQDILRESGADKYIRNGKTVPPGHVPTMPPEMAEGLKTLPPQAGPQGVAPSAHRPTVPRHAQLERPICLERGARKGLFSRLFG